ncbi:MAG TPA: DUF456 domain-containing protein [Methylophilus sp.]
MDWLFISAVALIVIGFLGILLPALPGVPMVFLGLFLIAWQDQFAKVSILTISIIGALALIAFVLDFAVSFITTKKVGASKQALWGLAIGALIGLFFGVFGIFFGAAIGALVGEFLAHRDLSRATNVGLAAGLGVVLAVIVKLLLAMIMVGLFAYAYYV